MPALARLPSRRPRPCPTPSTCSLTQQREFSIEELGALVRRHRADDSINKAIRRITRVDLIMVDDIDMLPVGEDVAEGFHRLVDACYEKRSLAVSSNLHPAASTRSCPRRWPPRPSTGSYTTPTSASPTASRSGSPKPPPERG
jgi:hypothetical protein